MIVHAPYLLNLASPDREGWDRSLDMLRREMARSAVLGASILVFHPGSHLKSGVDKGVARLGRALRIGLAEGEEGDPAGRGEHGRSRGRSGRAADRAGPDSGGGRGR